MVKNGKDLSLPFLFVILSFILSLSLYIYTLAPTVTFQDSGEYITAAYTLGIPHPPGNPTWCLLAKLFTYLPIGNIAYRVNFMSAFFGALSVAISFLIFREFLNIFNLSKAYPETLSFILTLIFAVSSAWWKKAVVAEVYTLNLFFMVSIIYLTIKISPLHNHRLRLIWLGLLMGLGLGNHLSLFFIFPAVFIYLLGPKVKFKKFIFIGCGLLLGLMVYLYLPLRSLKNPALDCGNPENITNFWWVLSRQQWGGLKWFNFSWSALRQGLEALKIGTELGLAGIGLALLGLVSLFFRHKKFFLLISLIFIFHSLGLLVLLIGNMGQTIFLLPSIDEFFIPSGWAGLLCAGCGILTLMRGKRIFLLLPAALIPLNFFNHFPRANHRGYYLAKDIGLGLMEEVEKNSLIFSKGDDFTFILLYLQEVEGLRKDILVIDRSLFTWPVYYRQYAQRFKQLKFTDHKRLLELQALARKEENTSRSRPIENNLSRLMIREIIQDNISSRPIYWILEAGDPWIEERLIPRGVIFKVMSAPVVDISPADLKVAKRKWLELEGKWLPWLNNPPDVYGADIMAMLANQLGIYFHRRALYAEAVSYYTAAQIISPGLDAAFHNSGLIYWQRGETKKALEEYKKMVAFDPYSQDGFFNLGRAYEELGRDEEALAAYQKSAWLAPHYADTYYRLGKCLERLGRIDTARSAYLRALKLDPRYAEARKALDLLK